jgi:hypothetical protein
LFGVSIFQFFFPFFIFLLLFFNFVVVILFQMCVLSFYSYFN